MRPFSAPSDGWRSVLASGCNPPQLHEVRHWIPSGGTSANPGRAFFYFDVGFMIWVLLGALGNYVAGEFGMTPTQKGLMTAIPLLGESLLRCSSGT
jgi:hypothetical protein